MMELKYEGLNLAWEIGSQPGNDLCQEISAIGISWHAKWGLLLEPTSLGLQMSITSSTTVIATDFDS